MIDQAKISGRVESASLRPGILSSSEAEGKRGDFREAMKPDAGRDETGDRPEGKAGGQSLEKEGEKSESAPAPPPLFSGDALLQGLGSSFAPQEVQAIIGPAQDASAALATELAERILVNTDNRGEGSEVRITLKDSVLPGTEIILRQEGERLLVQLVSSHPSSLDALRSAQKDLQDKLLALALDVSVEVMDSREGEAGDGRSRGLDYFTESEG